MQFFSIDVTTYILNALLCYSKPLLHTAIEPNYRVAKLCTLSLVVCRFDPIVLNLANVVATRKLFGIKSAKTPSDDEETFEFSYFLCLCNVYVYCM